jgi:hypothetical protein
MLDSLNPPKSCSICSVEQTEHDEFFTGYIGIVGVSFCDVCLDALVDMVVQLQKNPMLLDLEGGVQD